MNTYIQLQISNMKLMAKNFEQTCELAAKKDDGKIDEAEKKTIKQIKNATANFLKDLEKIK